MAGLTILVIEDEKACREILFPIWLAPLTEAHPDTKLVLLGNMNEALHYLVGNTPDLILLDLTLPDSPPSESIRKIPDLLKRAPVVVVSGSLEPDYEAGAMSEGAHGFFRKGHGALVPFLAGVRLRFSDSLRRIDTRIEELRKLVEP
jgi:DNA-binding NarL/FixJ family response regulator